MTIHWNYGLPSRLFLDFPSVNIEHIDIVCSEDFDAEHPAGSSLNDMVSIVGVSPKKFFDSGYLDRFDWTNHTTESFRRIYPEFLSDLALAKPNPDDNPSCEYIDYFPDFYPVEKKLTDVTPGDLALLRVFSSEYNQYPTLGVGYLVFDSMPASAVEMTITLGLNDGRVLSERFRWSGR
jgi:hypothetical protein